MRFIQIIGSKQNPVPTKKVISIKGIIKKVQNGQLLLQLQGNNLDKQATYDWMITFDNEVIVPSSVGPVLILSKSNTSKYWDSKQVDAIIQTKNYISQVFQI